jgi:hypothetical protein
MRTTRTLAAGLACLTLVPALMHAQARRSPRSVFEDSWYWGAKGGVALFESAAEKVTAPSVGAEWLITRHRVALYVSAEQSFFDTKAAVFDPTVAGSARPVDISNLRRYNIDLVGFPKQYGRYRPYVGIGYAISVIGDANPRGNFTSETSMDSVFTRVDDQSSRSSLVGLAGLQAHFGRYAVFGQVSSSSTRNNFLINGGAYTTFAEFGIRYNLTRAREPLN